MQKFKNIARRSGAFVIAVGFLGSIGSAILPAIASADALNPLTERSLTLSSSSPGWSYKDGSGNSTFAKPNTAANGKKTGNTFSFRVSSTANVEAFSFQYCTAPAGNCQAPGDNSGNELNQPADRGGDTSSTSDFNVAVNSPSEISSGNWSTINSRTGAMAGIPNPDGTEGNFVFLHKTNQGDPWTVSSGWDMTAKNQEESTNTQTGKNNYIVLTNSGGVSLSADDYVKVVFFATDDNYITNPGSGAFFAKINDYSTFTAGPPPTLDADDIVDGGVTVANVMNESISISTKVLETMDFSVGTVDPNTLTEGAGGGLDTATNGDITAHGQCDPILPALTHGDSHNVLKMGDSNAEYSLSTSKTYATHSYFRLSSNSSGGATVYYAGVTLSNTVGDDIDAIGNSATQPHTGTEQFGLALDNGGSTPYSVDYSIPMDSGSPPSSDGTEYGIDNAQVITNQQDGSNTNTNKGLSSDFDSSSFADGHDPQLAPLVPETNYGGGTGDINGSPATSFAFSPTANTIPEALASESNQVVDCVTGKVRYIGNIAATTPAGIYTTKINYIASPQY